MDALRLIIDAATSKFSHSGGGQDGSENPGCRLEHPV
jgi:hypothetical protein